MQGRSQLVHQTLISGIGQITAHAHTITLDYYFSSSLLLGKIAESAKKNKHLFGKNRTICEKRQAFVWEKPDIIRKKTDKMFT